MNTRTLRKIFARFFLFGDCTQVRSAIEGIEFFLYALYDLYGKLWEITSFCTLTRDGVAV